MTNYRRYVKLGAYEIEKRGDYFVIKNIENYKDKQKRKKLKAQAEAILEASDEISFSVVTPSKKLTLFAQITRVIKEITGLTPHVEQLMGALAMSESRIVDMKTGEGKTLTSLFPIIYFALKYEHIHVVTANDYLAERDAETNSEIYKIFGLSTSVNTTNSSPQQKHAAYRANIMYTTANALGFDYLDDQMSRDLANRYQPHEVRAVLIDEIDAILIDQSLTPYIQAVSAGDELKYPYWDVQHFVESLDKETDIYVNKPKRIATLTEKGEQKAIDKYGKKYTEMIHYLHNALSANFNFTYGQDYAIRKNDDGEKEVTIVDRNTGRYLIGQNYQYGLQQAIDMKHHKEEVMFHPLSITKGSITLQHLFRRYENITGMSGTIATERDEMNILYHTDVMEIPTHKEVKRTVHPTRMWATKPQKFKAIVELVAEKHAKGQPILLGTNHIDDSVALSEELTNKGYPNVVLNADQDYAEAQIVAKAGQTNAITIATNMAGRGTDIKLSDEAKELGGLVVIQSERNESKRVDQQLIGRSARQGDPGEVFVYISLEDDIFQTFNQKGMILNYLMYKDDDSGEIQYPKNLDESLDTMQEILDDSAYESRMETFRFNDINQRQAVKFYAIRERTLSDPVKYLRIDAIDKLWEVYLEHIGSIKQSVYLQFQNEEPLLNYQRQSNRAFEVLLNDIENVLNEEKQESVVSTNA